MKRTTPEDVLPPEEILYLQERGINAVRGHELEVPRMSDDKLRQFVLDFTAGLIFTDAMCEPNIVGMVFMPLALGGLRPAEETVKLGDDIIPDVGAEPEIPDPPPEPEYEEFPKAPELKLTFASPEWIDLLKADIAWEDADRSALDSYHDEVEAENDRIRDKHEKAMEAWRTEAEEIHERNHVLTEAWQTACAEHETFVNDFDELCQQWALADARRGAFWRGFYQQWGSNLGCIWEHYSQAGPRSINGCPIFLSMHVMHAEDMKRTSKAIQAEHERRQNITI